MAGEGVKVPVNSPDFPTEDWDVIFGLKKTLDMHQIKIELE